MPYIQVISFFHTCGHSENRVWSTDNELPHHTTRRILPIIDTVFINALEEGYTDETTEVHYQQGLCSLCQGKTVEPPSQAEADVLNGSRALWHEIISSFKAQLDNLNQMVEPAADSHSPLDTERLQLQRRLQELQQLISGAEAQPRGNAPNFAEVFGAIFFQGRMTAAELNNEARRDNIQYAAYQEEEQVHSRLAELGGEIADPERYVSQGSYFLAFTELRRAQEQRGVPIREQAHMLAPGWSNGLLTIATAPLREDGEPEEEECSICFFDLYSPGRCRSLPCGHLWHSECITQWLQTQDTCPTCRAQYRILRLPPWNDSALVDDAISTLRELRRAANVELSEDQRMPGGWVSSDSESD